MCLRLCILLTALHVCVARPMGLQEEGKLSLLLAMMDWSGFRAARHVPAIPRNDSVEVAVAAVCHPRNESVAIPHSLFNDSEGSFVIWPSCVELQRCSGCCTSGIRHCAPANTRQRHFLVTKLEYRGILRKRQVTVTMEEHMQCSCQCAFRLACPKRHALPHGTTTTTTTIAAAARGVCVLTPAWLAAIEHVLRRGYHAGAHCQLLVKGGAR
uniref:platelet-derived growth factor subunit A-like n=1 Tax=Myxine glutinosa TaxID=7769 RepID=UPI00358E5DB3